MEELVKLSHLSNKNTECLAKFEFYINCEKLIVYVPNIKRYLFCVYITHIYGTNTKTLFAVIPTCKFDYILHFTW